VTVSEGRDELLSGWGAGVPVRSWVLSGLDAGQLRELVISRPARGVLARGGGCSYGDAAQNAGGCVLLPAGPELIEPDTASATVRVGASVTFAALLARLVPLGLLPPVLPGTRHLTVGGAIAADVHGKNQHGDGSISLQVAGGDTMGLSECQDRDDDRHHEKGLPGCAGQSWGPPDARGPRGAGPPGFP
jgi:decaprenylphospho-beta-D-ribofuranose 2-oxidase